MSYYEACETGQIRHMNGWSDGFSVDTTTWDVEICSVGETREASIAKLGNARDEFVRKNGTCDGLMISGTCVRMNGIIKIEKISWLSWLFHDLFRNH